MASYLKRIQEEVASWPEVSVAPHRFGGKEFRFEKGEIGHVHFWGDVDIPFTRAIRDLLLAQGVAEPHRWVPDSGWITFHLRDDADVGRAIWLMRLSYLRYALKASPEPRRLLEQEADKMQLDAKIVSLLSQFVRSRDCSQVSV